MTSEDRILKDEELVSAAYSGDKEAFSELYTRYISQIYRFIYYRVTDQDEAEDLTETVFVKAWEALPNIQLRGFYFKAWIYRIARNAVVDRHRTHRPSATFDNQVTRSDPGDSPEEQYQNNEVMTHLNKLITRLEPDLQDVILYRFFMGFSHSETSSIMNRSVIYVRVLQHRALKKLRDLMKLEISEHD